MIVDVLELGDLYTNCYFLIKNNDLIIVDPASSFDLIKNKIGNLNLVGIFVTHGHDDHIGALKDIKKNYNVDIYDFSNLEEKNYKIGSFSFDVIFTPGHTSDSVTFYFKDEKIMFVGDFIFKDTVGRTDFPTGDYLVMLNSIAKIKKYDNAIIYPGHGEFTTLEYEKNNNYFFKEDL